MTRNETATLARQLLDKHRLYHWHFTWNRRKRAYGLCSHGKREISLSVYLFATMTDERIRDCLLHEIAHALTPGHKHDHVWRMKAVEIGADPSTTHEMDNPEYKPPYKWVIKYGDEVVAGYYRKPKRDMSTCYIPGRKETLGKLRIERA